jgi:hypothetical protein
MSAPRLCLVPDDEPQFAATSAWDADSAEGVFIARERAALLRHLGKAPSAVQLRIIDLVAKQQLRLHLFEKQLAAGRKLTSREEQTYASLNSGVARNLFKLGAKRAPKAKVIAEPAVGAIWPVR